METNVPDYTEVVLNSIVAEIDGLSNSELNKVADRIRRALFAVAWEQEARLERGLVNDEDRA
jgi:hypothetical protein